MTNEWTVFIDFYDDDYGWRHKLIRRACNRPLKVTHCAPRMEHPVHGSWTMVTHLGSDPVRMMDSRAYWRHGLPKCSFRIAGRTNLFGPGIVMKMLKDMNFSPNTLKAMLWWYLYIGNPPDSCVTVCNVTLGMTDAARKTGYCQTRYTPWSLYDLMVEWERLGYATKEVP